MPKPLVVSAGISMGARAVTANPSANAARIPVNITAQPKKPLKACMQMHTQIQRLDPLSLYCRCKSGIFNARAIHVTGENPASCVEITLPPINSSRRLPASPFSAQRPFPSLPPIPVSLSAWMFIDEIKVYARAGHGGKGAVAFHREAYVPKGGPSGGNGGRGGDVILEADHDLNNLIGQFYNPRLIAESGEGGMGKGMDGHAGKDLIIKVPVGTMVWKLQDTTPKPAPKKV